MIKRIKDIRIQLDGLAQLTKDLRPLRIDYNDESEIDRFYIEQNSQEIKNCHKSLLLAKAWLGKTLEQLNDNKDSISPFVYRVELYSHLAENTEDGYIIYVDGERKKIKLNIFQFESVEQLTYDEIINKYKGTQGIKDITGNFKSPYSNDGKRKTVEDIEAVADTQQPLWFETTTSHIERVDWLRQEIQLVLDQVIMIGELDLEPTVYNDIVFKQVAVHLTEARFWLGFELQRIKENNNA